jgi:hypothetical protein
MAKTGSPSKLLVPLLMVGGVIAGVTVALLIGSSGDQEGGTAKAAQTAEPATPTAEPSPSDSSPAEQLAAIVAMRTPDLAKYAEMRGLLTGLVEKSAGTPEADKAKVLLFEIDTAWAKLANESLYSARQESVQLASAGSFDKAGAALKSIEQRFGAGSWFESTGKAALTEAHAEIDKLRAEWKDKPPAVAVAMAPPATVTDSQVSKADEAIKKAIADHYARQRNSPPDKATDRGQPDKKQPKGKKKGGRQKKPKPGPKPEPKPDPKPKPEPKPQAPRNLGENILTNGGFEEIREQTRFASGWIKQNWGGSGTWSVRSDHTNPRSGDRAIVIRSLAEGQKPGSFCPIRIKKGTYYVSFWACADVGEKATVSAQLAGTDIDAQTIGEDYALVAGTVVVEKDSNGADLRIWLETKGARVWIDDAQVQPVK